MRYMKSFNFLARVTMFSVAHCSTLNIRGLERIINQ